MKSCGAYMIVALVLVAGQSRAQEPAVLDTMGWAGELAAFASLPDSQRQDHRTRAENLIRPWLPPDRTNRARPFEDPYHTLARNCFLRARSHTFTFNSLLGQPVDFLSPALVDLRAALELDPTRVRARMALGMAEITAGLYLDGAAQLARARQLMLAAGDGSAPGSRELLDVCNRRLAYGLLQCGAWEHCSQVAAAARKAGPSSYYDIIEGLRLARGGRTAEAIAYAVAMPPVSYRHQTALSSGMYPRPSDFANRWIKSQALLAEGDASGALHVLGDLESLADRPLPMAREFWQDTGLVCEVLGDEAALAYYKLVAGYSFDAWFCTPSAYLAAPTVLSYPDPRLPAFISPQGGFVGGSPFTFLALQLNRAMEDPTAETGRLAAARGLEMCDIQLRRNILPAVVQAFRGRILDAIGRAAESHAALTFAHDRFKARGDLDAGTWLLLGLQEIKAGRREQGLGLVREVTVAEPANALAWRTLGVAWSMLDDQARAREAMDRALTLEPNSLAGWFNAGVLAYRNQAFDQALSCLEQAWRLDPGNARVQRMLQVVASAKRQARAVTSSPDH